MNDFQKSQANKILSMYSNVEDVIEKSEEVENLEEVENKEEEKEDKE